MGTQAAITIDELTKEDLDQVMAIESFSFSQPWSRNHFLAEFRNKPISQMLAARTTGEIRELIGYIVCWVFVDEVHILDLATRKDARRRGVARQLVLAALQKAYVCGARKAFLEVRASNAPARELYGGIGFLQSQVREEYYDNPIEDAVVMRLEADSYRNALGGTADIPS